MALASGDYDDLFEDIGEFVQRDNDFKALYAALDTDLSEIVAELAANGRQDVLSGVPEMFEGFKDQIAQWREQLRGKVTERLTNRDAILEKLDGIGDSTDVQAVLALLVKFMNDDSESIDDSAVTIGSVTADAVNSVVAAQCLLDKVLDGASAPVRGGQANPEYAGVDSELALTSDSMTITCTGDSDTDGRTEGSETWEWVGKPGRPSDFDSQDPGSGNGPTLTTLNGYSILSNLEFEDFTTNAPDDWDVDAGTAGTHIDDEASTVQRGSKALKLTGDAALASIQISQTVPANALVPLKRYCVACWVQGNAGLTQGALTIQFAGTGYTPGATEKIAMDQAALAAQTAYGVEYFFFNAPAEIPDDFELTIVFNGTPSAHSIYIDGMAFGPAEWHNGICAAILAGPETILRGDRFTFDVTNDDDGVFQAYFRDAYKVQLPSNSSPTNADTLAT